METALLAQETPRSARETLRSARALERGVLRLVLRQERAVRRLVLEILRLVQGMLRLAQETRPLAPATALLALDREVPFLVQLICLKANPASLLLAPLALLLRRPHKIIQASLYSVVPTSRRLAPRVFLGRSNPALRLDLSRAPPRLDLSNPALHLDLGQAPLHSALSQAPLPLGLSRARLLLALNQARLRLGLGVLLSQRALHLVLNLQLARHLAQLKARLEPNLLRPLSDHSPRSLPLGLNLQHPPSDPELELPLAPSLVLLALKMVVLRSAHKMDPHLVPSNPLLAHKTIPFQTNPSLLPDSLALLVAKILRLVWQTQAKIPQVCLAVKHKLRFQTTSLVNRASKILSQTAFHKQCKHRLNQHLIFKVQTRILYLRTVS